MVQNSHQDSTGILSTQSSIYIAGHNGMVGSAIMRRLKKLGYTKFVTRTHQELDLTDQASVRDLFQNEKIDYVVLAAAKVGGIYANDTYPAEFIYQNLMVQANVIHEAYASGVDKLLFLGSSCIYPKFAPQPMKEEYLLTGVLEPTNEPYAIAKIAGIKMCEAYNRQYGTQYYSVMPTNLYGPGDNFHLENSHVIPAMIRKFHLAKLAQRGDLKGIQQDEVTQGTIPNDIREAIGLADDSSSLIKESADIKVFLWGSGKARREFLHVDDMAAACMHIMQLESSAFSQSFINVGCGSDNTILEIAEMVQEAVGFEGEILFNTEQPDGTMQKLLDVQQIKNFDWKPDYSLEKGLSSVYQWYCQRIKSN